MGAEPRLARLVHSSYLVSRRSCTKGALALPPRLPHWCPSLGESSISTRLPPYSSDVPKLMPAGEPQRCNVAQQPSSRGTRASARALNLPYGMCRRAGVAAGQGRTCDISPPVCALLVPAMQLLLVSEGCHVMHSKEGIAPMHDCTNQVGNAKTRAASPRR